MMVEAEEATKRLNVKKQTLDDAYAAPANFLEIDVVNPSTTMMTGKKRYTDYEVRMRTNLPVFKVKESSVRRRYSDFEWLRNELERDSKIVVPPLPSKAWKRQMPFRGDDGLFDEHFIEDRRKGLEIFINKIAGHPLAQNERCLHMFLQEPIIDKNYVPVSNTSMQYGQNISIPYSQPQADNNMNMFNVDHKNNLIKTKMERDRDDVINQQILQNVNQSWQTLANPANSVDYSSHILSATLPISIQHFLKYSETIKKEQVGQPLNSGGLGGMDPTTGFNIKSDMMGLKNGISSHGGMNGMIHSGMNNHGHGLDSVNMIETSTSVPTATTTTTKSGKKKKIKPPKVKTEKKPRPKPGEIRETKALDGSTLYCCPECQMAYPVRSLIEQHVVSHAIERRFVCEICNAALKRKDHLTRHKLSHSPDRPHVCNICLKSFKRKEQLTLHVVIHSGEKKHVCQECGKGFYRKDHLRKHTRSHIARRVKSEVSAQSNPNTNNIQTTNLPNNS